MRRVVTAALCAALALGLASVLGSPPRVAAATPSGPEAAGTLALANAGRGAGTCSKANPATNSLGGDAFRSSCHGYAGEPEYWCADFAAWAWEHSGLFVGGLTAAASSFVTSGAGIVHRDPGYVPKAGDAIVFNYDGGRFADHVGIVGSLGADGSVLSVNGDFGGRGSGADFARSSRVVLVRIAARNRSVGSVPGRIGMAITEYVSPRPVQPASPAAVVDGAGIPNAFWRSPTGDLRHAYAIDGSWSVPERLAGGAYGDPVAGPLPDVAWTTGSGQILRSRFSAGAWRAPRSLPTGGQVVSGQLAIAIDGSGIENVFWRGSDRRLYHDYLLDGRWVGPEAIAEDQRSDPSATTDAGGALVVLARGRGGALLRTAFEGGAWSSATLSGLGGSTSKGRPAVALAPTGQLRALWLQPDGSLATAPLSGSVAQAVELIASGVAAGPSARWSGSSLDVAWLGADGTLEVSSLGPGGWSAAEGVAIRRLQGSPAVLRSLGDPSLLWLTASGALQASSRGSGAWATPLTLARP